MQISRIYRKWVQWPIPATAWSKAWVSPLGCWDRGFESRWGYRCFFLWCLYGALSCVGRGLCDELITRPKESYHVSDMIQKPPPKKSENVDKRSNPKTWNDMCDYGLMILTVSNRVVDHLLHSLRGATNRRFITAFTTARNRPLSWASWIHSTPQPISLRSILIQFSHLRLLHPSGLFPSGFPTKTLYTFLSSPIRATCPTHLIILDLICLMVLGNEENYEAPHCATSSIVLVLHPS
jgi:hypothetical protein